MSGVRDWDATTYDRISGPMEALGLKVLARLPLAGGETVIDAGCGSGRITQALIELLPRGQAIGIDMSPSMARVARERLGAQADIRVMDLLELEVEQPVDAILSTATFHWITDHPALFARLHATLRTGGRLVAQCGGEGNIDTLRGVANAVLAREPYAAHFEGFQAPWNYANPGDTHTRLLAAGFAQAECWLEPAPTKPAHPRQFLQTIVLRPHVEYLPERLRDPFLDAVLDELGKPVVVDYIRLNIDAVA